MLSPLHVSNQALTSQNDQFLKAKASAQLSVAELAHATHMQTPIFTEVRRLTSRHTKKRYIKGGKDIISCTVGVCCYDYLAFLLFFFVNQGDFVRGFGSQPRQNWHPTARRWIGGR